MSYSILPSPRWSRKSKKHKGYPIRFRIKIGDAPHFYEKTNLYIEHRDYWNTKFNRAQKCKDADRINLALDTKFKELRSLVLTDLSEDKALTRETIKGKKIPTLSEYALQVRKSKKTTQVILNRIKKLNGGREPRLSEITAEWCRRIQNKMQTEPIPEGDKRKGKLKMTDKAKKCYSDTTINCTMRLLRKVQNVALLEGAWKKKVIGKGLYDPPKQAKHAAVYLVREQRERWRQGMVDYVLGDPQMHMALVYFMLGCYAGLRISDWYLFDPKTKIKGDTIHLFTHKTDGEVVYDINRSLRLVLNEIDRIGPLTINENKVRRLLKKISKHDYFAVPIEIKPHVARHSFGRYMVEEGVAESDCAFFMGIGVNVVKRVYYHISNKDRRERYKHLADR